jgi:hypothetical protein
MALAWTQRSYELLQEGRLQASICTQRGIQIERVDGACPYCGDAIGYAAPRTVVTEGSEAKLTADLDYGGDGPAYTSITVTCGCAVTHPGNPAKGLGCGTTFRIEIEVDSGDARQYRLPERGPVPAEVADRDRFQALVQGSLPAVRGSAEKWRNGLAALVTLVAGGLLIKGVGDATDLTTEWRIVLSVLAGGGLATAVYGLWRALRAAAGVPEVTDTDVVTMYGSVLGYEVALAKRASNDLRWARKSLVAALVLLGGAVVASLWAEKESPSPPAFVEVDTGTPKPICGTLKSADNGNLIVQVKGEQNPRTITFTEVKNLRVKASC